MVLKRSIFPLCNITVAINGEKVKLSPAKKVVIPLKEAESYCIGVTMPLLFKKNHKTVSHLSENTVINIKSRLSDKYYLLAGGFTLIVCFLLFFGKIPMLFFSLVLLLYIIPISYYSFVKTDRYFVIEIN